MSERQGSSADLAAMPWHRRVGARAEASWHLFQRPVRIGIDHGLERSPLVIAGAAAGLLLGLVLLAAIVDAAAANGSRALPHWFVGLFNEITDFGKSGWLLWPLGVFLIATAALPNALPAMSQRVLAALVVRAEFLFAAIAAPSLVVTIVKRFIGRARPFVGGTVDPFLFSPSAWTAAYAGFPSGHATTAVAAAVAISMVWPRARTVIWIYAALIMASRVIITAHYPTDVLAGALAGAAGVLAVRRYFAWKRRGFSIAADGSIIQFTGPSWRRTKAVARNLLAD